jgi:amino acid adenylation domain-containing protein
MDPLPLASDLQHMSQADQRALLARLLKQKSERSHRFPMSAGQQGLWHAFRRDPAATPFNAFLPTRVRSHINIEAFRQAIYLLAQRHACLRTRFSDRDGELVQTIDDDLKPDFTVQELLGYSETSVRQIVVEETLRPFDLERGPLLRLRLYKLADDDWVMLAITHHIVVDFWSLILILQELRTAIPEFGTGRLPTLPAAVSNYAEFVREQAEFLAGSPGQQQKNFWQQVVSRGAPVLELPLDYVRPGKFTGRAATTALQFSTQASQQLQSFALQMKATPFSILHATLQLLLSRYSEQDSFFIGSPFSGRTQRKFEQTVGFFVNMLPVHAHVRNDESFTQLVARTSRTLLDALEHESYPISQIVHDSSIQRDPSRSPLFQVSCTYEKAQLKEESGRASFLFPDSLQAWDFGGFKQESFYVPHQTCHYDLEFVFEQAPDRMRGIIVYCRDLFDASTIELISQNFAMLLTELLAHPHTPLAQIVWHSFADPTTDNPNEPENCRDLTVPDMLAASAAQTPSAIALQSHGVTMTYAQLLQAARRIGRALRQQGIGSGDVVPVIAKRGPDAFVAMLGVQLSGAAPIPMDADQPSVDLQTLIEDSQARAVICDFPTSYLNEFAGLILHVSELAEAKQFVEPPATTPSSIDLAYVIYTSGSTGKPKGVMIEHAAVCNTLAWRMKDVSLGPEDRVLMLLSHQFDAALGVGWTTLTQSACLVFAEDVNSIDANRILDQMIRDQISVLPIIPSLLRVLVENPRFATCKSLRQIWTGGESLPPDLPSLIRQVSEARIWNFYGPTEAAIEATACDVTDHAPARCMSIGRAIDNTDILILNRIDDNRLPVPDSVPGEIAIAGAGLARGYLNRPELTAEKFVSPRHETSAERMYLTGDRGRKLADGTIEFLGRMDHQIKLRGYRIELGEIEATLEQHPEVERAAVKLLQAGTPAAHLAAFVSLQHAASGDKSFTKGDHQHRLIGAQLRRFATERLSAFKVPTTIVVVERMPLTTSGKVDRKQLPEADAGTGDLEQHIAPRTPIEEFLARAWSKTLDLERISVDVNFFDAGGSSLQAAMLTSRVSDELGVHVPTSLLFDLADISQMALRLTQLHSGIMCERFGEGCLQQQLEATSSVPSSTVSHPLLAELKTTGRRTPIFLVHPPGGIVVCYHELAKQMPIEQPLYGIRSHGLYGAEDLPNSLEAMAAEYLNAIRAVQTAGPYVIGGWSLGGLVAYEMAQQLLSAGAQVQLLLLDTTIPENATELVPAVEQASVGLEYGIDLSLDQLGELAPAEQLPFLWQHAQNLGVLEDQSSPEVIQQVLSELQGLFHHHVRLARQYRLQPLAADVTLFRPTDVPFEINVTEDRGWRHLVRSVHVVFVPGHHHSMVQLPHVATLAKAMSPRDEVDTSSRVVTH